MSNLEDTVQRRVKFLAVSAGMKEGGSAYNGIDFLEKKMRRLAEIEQKARDMGYRSVDEAFLSCERTKKKLNDLSTEAYRYGFKTVFGFLKGFRRLVISNYTAPSEVADDEEVDVNWDEEVRIVFESCKGI